MLGNVWFEMKGIRWYERGLLLPLTLLKGPLRNVGIAQGPGISRNMPEWKSC